MSRLLKALCALSCTWGAACNAETFHFECTRVVVPLIELDNYGTLECPKFDPALGRLQAITIGVGGGIFHWETVTNLSQQAAYILIEAEARTALPGLPGIQFNAYTVSARSFIAGNFAAGESRRTQGAGGGETAWGLGTWEPAFAGYTGLGTFEVPFHTSPSINVRNGTFNYALDFRSEFRAGASGSYTYTTSPPVPEPATWAAMLLGILLIAAHRRGHA